MEPDKVTAKPPPTGSKGGRKGSPQADPSANLDRPVSKREAIVPMGFKVQESFRKEYKTYAAMKGKKMVEVLMESFKLYKKHNPKS